MAHVSEELLEQYRRRTLSRFQSEWIEGHLLICTACQDRLQTELALVTAIRLGALRFARTGWHAARHVPQRMQATGAGRRLGSPFLVRNRA